MLCHQVSVWFHGHASTTALIGLTIYSYDSVPDRVHDGMDRRNTRNGPMKQVEGRKFPTSSPKEWIVAPTKQPQQAEVGVRQDTRPIRHVPPHLIPGILPTITCKLSPQSDYTRHSLEIPLEDIITQNHKKET